MKEFAMLKFNSWVIKIKNNIIEDKDLKTVIVKIYYLLNSLICKPDYLNGYYSYYLNFITIYNLNLFFNKL